MVALSKTRRLQFFGTSDLLIVVPNLKTKIESFYLKMSGISKMLAVREKGIACKLGTKFTHACALF